MKSPYAIKSSLTTCGEYIVGFRDNQGGKVRKPRTEHVIDFIAPGSVSRTHTLADCLAANHDDKPLAELIEGLRTQLLEEEETFVPFQVEVEIPVLSSKAGRADGNTEATLEMGSVLLQYDNDNKDSEVADVFPVGLSLVGNAPSSSVFSSFTVWSPGMSRVDMLLDLLAVNDNLPGVMSCRGKHNSFDGETSVRWQGYVNKRANLYLYLKMFDGYCPICVSARRQMVREYGNKGAVADFPSVFLSSATKFVEIGRAGTQVPPVAMKPPATKKDAPRWVKWYKSATTVLLRDGIDVDPGKRVSGEQYTARVKSRENWTYELVFMEIVTGGTLPTAVAALRAVGQDATGRRRVRAWTINDKTVYTKRPTAQDPLSLVSEYRGWDWDFVELDAIGNKAPAHYPVEDDLKIYMAILVLLVHQNMYGTTSKPIPTLEDLIDDTLFEAPAVADKVMLGVMCHRAVKPVRVVGVLGITR